MNLSQPQIDSLLEGAKEVSELHKKESDNKGKNENKYESKYKKDGNKKDDVVNSLTKLLASGMNISQKAKDKIEKILKQKAEEKKNAT